MTLGLTPDGRIQKIAFTEINETKGLGMKANDDDFKNQFEGKGGTLKLGDSGEQGINAITGATVTSTAVVNAVNAGLKFFETVTKGGN